MNDYDTLITIKNKINLVDVNYWFSIFKSLSLWYKNQMLIINIFRFIIKIQYVDMIYTYHISSSIIEVGLFYIY